MKKQRTANGLQHDNLKSFKEKIPGQIIWLTETRNRLTPKNEIVYEKIFHMA